MIFNDVINKLYIILYDHVDINLIMKLILHLSTSDDSLTKSKALSAPFSFFFDNLVFLSSQYVEST